MCKCMGTLPFLRLNLSWRVEGVEGEMETAFVEGGGFVGVATFRGWDILYRGWAL